MQKFYYLSLFLLISVSVFSQNIRINQIGYYSSSQKIATVPGNQSGAFEVINNQTGQTVYTGTLPSSARTWSASDESIKLADFTDFTTVGTYYIKTSSETSHLFEIKSTNLYDEMLTWAAKGFYLWRSSTAISAQHATFRGVSYARSVGHPGTNVKIHSSAATSQRPEGTIVSAPKGWYDAGDYNLYTINAGVSVFTLAHVYELYPDFFASKSFNIPESNNNTPDILDEIKWELDWLLAMQDLDGSVYFKLTSKWFSAYVMPANDDLERFMVGKTTTSALNFAALTAMAYRLYKNSIDYPGFADICLEASQKAWQWARNNPSISYTNPSDINTGEYGDTYFGDEFFWAAAELFISTGQQSYYNELNFNIDFLPLQWHYVAGNGIMSLALHRDNLPSFADKSLIMSKFTGFAESIYNIYNLSAYKIPMNNFFWGSNGNIASKSVVLGTAHKLLNANKYKIAAEEGLNYLLGRNATGYCFVSGFGSKFPIDLHDRPSQSDGIPNSIPGYLAGGPNLDAQSDCGVSSYPSSSYPARSYFDNDCSYSTNEIAINWQAPLVALLAITEIVNSSSSNIDSDINTLINGEFDNGTLGWEMQYHNETSGTFNVVTNQNMSGTNSAQICPTIASTENWHIQLRQNAPFVAQKYYEISFMAKANASRTINVGLQMEGEPWTTHWDTLINISTSNQTYNFIFYSTESDATAKLKFHVGSSTTCVYIDNVVFKETDATAPPTFITVDGSTNFCMGESVLLSANYDSSFEYQWKKDNINIEGATSFSYLATQSGSYTVEVSSHNISTTSNPVVVTVNELPIATISASGNTTFCVGEHVVLNANTGTNYTYSWWLNETTEVGTNASSLPIYLSSGSYTVEVENAQGCKSISDPTLVTVNSIPDAPNTVSTIFYTIGQQAEPLFATGTNLQWYNTLTDESPSAIAPTPNTSVAGTVNYYVSQSVNACESSRAEIAVVISEAVNSIVRLQAGWNLIGSPLRGSIAVDEALSSIWNYLEIVKNMDAYYIPLHPTHLNSLNSIEWGKGYLIKVTDDCELDWRIR